MNWLSILWRVLGGFAIVIVSFWLTLHYLDWNKSTFEVGIDRPTPDYKAGNAGAPPAPEKCAANCERDANCASWVYINPSAERAAPACLFIPNVPKANRNPCCISGVVNRSFL